MSKSKSAKTAKTFGPYSLVRQAGDLYFLAGHVGVDPATSTAQPNVTAQTEQVLENLRSTLESVGLGMNDVVKTTIFVTDIGNFAQVNEVYVRYFDEPRPARSTVGVAELPRVGGDVPLLVEIEAVAVGHKE
ncbi:MAG TPA: Rid family detoxifying hydrolase [Candidatus Saccharimonadales bacterium]|nr:Rid family detoxifying hydrolase [Candidatus Saccharimonadales bacterium]